ncbi:MAG: PD-(D/E)XK nuclease family protein [Anaerolineae bacterium]|nr:PD-(D/E)XK nuclease family protein [Anaerolineae bacterium]
MIEHLSLSSVKTYLGCPKLFWFQYVEKVPTLKNPWAVFGTAVHNTVEGHIRDMTLTGTTTVDLQARWLAEWPAAQAAEDVDWTRANRDALFHAGVRVFGNFTTAGYIDRMRAMVIEGQPLIETFFKFELEGVGVPVLGYVDIVTQDGVPGDFKTARRPWTPEQARRELQPLVYLMGLRSLGLEMPEGHFRHYVIPSDGYAALQVIESTHSPERIAQMQEIIRDVWNGIAAGRFHCNPTYQWCGRYCPYVETCHP